MPTIITEERFLSRARDLTERYKALKEKFPQDDNWRKLNRVIRTLKHLYPKDKVYAVKQLNYLERVQITFTEERHALIVQTIELLQKLILHKKLQKPE